MFRSIQKPSPRLVAEPHTRFPPLASVIRKFRITADVGKPNETDYVLANPPFNDSVTALRACAFPRSGATMQTLSEAKDNFRKDDDVRWQWSGATWTTTGSPEGSRGGANQFGVPPMTARRGSAFQKSEGTPQVVSRARDNNANFAWVQHFIHCIRRSLGEGGHLAPQGMAGFVLANGSMSSNQSGEGDIRRALIEAGLVDCMVARPGQLFGNFEMN